MIIYLDGPAAFFAAPPSPRDREALIELGEAGYKSKHLVLSARPILAGLGRAEWLSVRARSYYQRVFEEYAELGLLLKRIPRYVVASATTHIEVFSDGRWHLPLARFADDRLLYESALVCENENDFDIYHSLAEAALRKKLPGCKLALQSKPGGGAATGGVLARLIEKRNLFALCIVDSDKELARGAEGGTAKGCRKAFGENCCVDLIVLDARELENLIPVSLVRAWAEWDNRDIPFLDELEHLPNQISHFVCLKTGDFLCRFFEVDPGHQGFRATREALDTVAKTRGFFAKCKSGCSKGGCRSPKLGEKFLERFGEWLRGPGKWVDVGYDRWSEELHRVVERIEAISLALPRKL